MSKKAIKMLTEYQNKIDTEVWLNNHGFSTREVSATNLKEISRNFSDMVTYMFRFNLLSANDFENLFNVCDIYFNALDKLV